MSEDGFLLAYLGLAALPTLVGWWRGASAGACYAAILFGVLLGWTLVGWLLAWALVLFSGQQEPLVRITTQITILARDD
jgi:hypothetical protein